MNKSYSPFPLIALYAYVKCVSAVKICDRLAENCITVISYVTINNKNIEDQSAFQSN